MRKFRAFAVIAALAVAFALPDRDVVRLASTASHHASATATAVFGIAREHWTRYASADRSIGSTGNGVAGRAAKQAAPHRVADARGTVMPELPGRQRALVDIQPSRAVEPETQTRDVGYRIGPDDRAIYMADAGSVPEHVSVSGSANRSTSRDAARTTPPPVTDAADVQAAGVPAPALPRWRFSRDPQNFEAAASALPSAATSPAQPVVTPQAAQPPSSTSGSAPNEDTAAVVAPPPSPAKPPAKPADETNSNDARSGNRGPSPTAQEKANDVVDAPAEAKAAAIAEPPTPLPKPEPPEAKPPIAAKLLFGAAKSPAPLAARAIGFYSKGCLAGARALPVDGPAWQAMRLSRNRNWGHPKLIAMIEALSLKVQKEVGWPGLLVGDMSQPRGGPMLTGHSSHQVGLDADIWFTPMPGRRLSKTERENLSAKSMIDGPTKVDPTAFTDGHVKAVKLAASFPEVERILVHPAIKKAMCEAAGKDRAWLSKVRPYFGHHYHFHVRLGCPKGSSGCRSQNPPGHEDGCDKELDYWFKRLTRPPPPKPPVAAKPKKPKPPLSLADLPGECRAVIEAGGAKSTEIEEAELIRSSAERAKKIIDISGRPRSEVMARKRSQ